jgi:hypothetical protein
MAVRRTGSLLAAALAGAVVLALPGVASAAVAVTPLTSKVAVTGARAGLYSATTGHPYWSVVAVYPPADQDYDLGVYDNAGHQLASSAYGTGTVDFVAIDSNHRALGTYQVSVTGFAGATGQYRIELADPGTILPKSGTVCCGEEYVFTNGDFIEINDVYLTAGSEYGLGNSFQGELFLMGDNPVDSSTWVRSRANAVAYTSPVPGGAYGCALYRAPRSGWYGLISIDDPPPGGQHGLQRFSISPASATDPAWQGCHQYS